MNRIAAFFGGGKKNDDGDGKKNDDGDVGPEKKDMPVGAEGFKSAPLFKSSLDTPHETQRSPPAQASSKDVLSPDEGSQRGLRPERVEISACDVATTKADTAGSPRQQSGMTKSTPRLSSMAKVLSGGVGVSDRITRNSGSLTLEATKKADSIKKPSSQKLPLTRKLGVDKSDLPGSKAELGGSLHIPRPQSLAERAESFRVMSGTLQSPLATVRTQPVTTAMPRAAPVTARIQPVPVPLARAAPVVAMPVPMHRPVPVTTALGGRPYPGSPVGSLSIPVAPVVVL